MKILVVDDHVLIRQALHGVLKKLRRDAVVLEASNSEKAMQVLTENPDLASSCSTSTCPIATAFRCSPKYATGILRSPSWCCLVLRIRRM